MTQVYSERVYPSPSGWLLPLAGAILVGMAALPVNVWVALGAATAIAIAIAIALIATSPHITVTDQEFCVDRARMPRSAVSNVIVADQAAMRQAMGPQLDARAYVRYRAWAGSGVRVDLADPIDPTPYWLVSSRRPHDLREAVLTERTLR